MTTSETSTGPATPAPKYRYFTAPPETLYLKVDDLTAFLPEGAWIGTVSDKQRVVPVPAAGILETNYPRISFSTLCDLLPGCIRRRADAPEWIALPADRIALAYKPETRRELLETEPSPFKPEHAPSAPAWKRVPKPVLASVPSAAPLPEVKSEPPKAPSSLADFHVSRPSGSELADMFGSSASLSVQQLVEKCQSLPGVKACLLRRGDETVKAGDIPTGLDAPGVGAEAFAATRKISAKSGLKFKKALTLYLDSGPVSFLRHGGLILIMLHVESDLALKTQAKLKLVLQAIERAAAPKT